MLIPVYIGVRDDEIESVTLVSNIDYTDVTLTKDPDFAFFHMGIEGILSPAEKAQLKAVLNYLI